MLRANTQRSGNVLQVTLEGVIDETTDLSKTFEPAKSVEVYCKGVERINSSGIRQWVSLFRGLRQSGSKIKFYELTPSLVEQANMIEGFIEKDQAESLFVVYFCAHCDDQRQKLMKADELIKSGFSVQAGACEVCQSKLELDVYPEEYFRFLQG